MRARLEAIMNEHGEDLVLVRRESGEEIPVRAFLQPFLKEQEELPVTATPLGAVSDQRWLYIGPAATELEPGDWIRFQEKCYAVQEAMTICFRQRALYGRAILRRKKKGGKL